VNSALLVFGGMVVAFCISGFFVPLITRLATKKHFFDRPDDSQASDRRKFHDVPVPRFGGLGFFLAFLITYGILAPRSPLDISVLSASGAFILGFIDDLKGLSAKLRLFVQLFLAFFVCWRMNLWVSDLYLPNQLGIHISPAFGVIFGVFVIVGAINAFNMIDGLDGLATICGMISILGLSALIIDRTGDVGLFIFFSGPIIGSLLGFLRSNIHPAEIFMGDGGSNWIGFIVGILFLTYLAPHTGFYSHPMTSLPYVGLASGASPSLVLAILCVAVPIVDAASVITARIIRRHNPMKADRRHIHHKLLEFGFGHSAVVSILTVLSAFFASVAVAISFFGNQSWPALIGFILLSSFICVAGLMANDVLPERRGFTNFFKKDVIRASKFSYQMNKAWMSRLNFLIIAAADVLSVVGGLYLSFLLRLDFLISADFFVVFKKVVPLAVVSYLLISIAVRQYQQIYRFATLGSVLQLFRTQFLALILLSGLIYFGGLGPYLPKSIVLMQFVLTLMIASFVRFIPRMVRASSYLIPADRTRPRALVYGAGAAGELLARHSRNDPSFPYNIAGFIDDDLGKIGRFLHGFRILGKGADLVEITARYNIENVLVAMHSLDGVALRKVVNHCQEAGVTPMLVPDLGKSIDPKSLVVRPVDVKDLLQRTPKATNRALIEGHIVGQIVLVTGAGGSIGSEICRQILQFKPKKLLLVDASEFNLYSIHTEILDSGVSADVVTPLLGSVTDARFIDTIFKTHKPNYVFHAAAYKHVHLVEMNQSEAIINNVLGTKILASAAVRHKTKKFLLISTDKAVRPTSVMGASKRCCELIVQCFQTRSDNETCFGAVRFGNVLGSSGSVVPRFMEQIKNGGPVTVTHPDVTRYFMLISEAVALVLQSIVMAKGGEIFVLNMGQAIKIYDMAVQIIRLAGREPGRDIEIVFSGLKPGEKLFEELLLEGHESRTDHDDVFELVGGIKDSSSVMAKIDFMIEAATKGRTIEAVHAMWSMAKHGNETQSMKLSPEVDHHAPVN
jgi:FlaA1/EpsC-like NDP-sugar epimerase/UDP-N-acetylmuramyl pentapeptide phosphotransferase/UDP-N-acetylglucosamine-1-phosphate transferase